MASCTANHVHLHKGAPCTEAHEHTHLVECSKDGCAHSHDGKACSEVRNRNIKGLNHAHFHETKCAENHEHSHDTVCAKDGCSHTH